MVLDGTVAQTTLGQKISPEEIGDASSQWKVKMYGTTLTALKSHAK